MDIQFNYACPCSPTNTLIEMNESFASQFQTATIIPMFLWQPSWSYPIEGLAIGLLISLIVYYRMVYSTKLFPHEKLRLILNITHKTQTPLTLIHHLLEEIISDSLSESTSQKVKRILRYTSHIMSCYQNIAVFDDKENELHPGSSPIEFELYTFITSIVNQCRAYADTRQIKLNINKDFSYISCRVDEITMTAALQCLLNKMIEATPCKGCINMDVSHSIKHWNLQITNGPECRQSHKKMLSFISTFMLIHYCGSLQIIKKIIRLHGGKLIGSYHGRSITLRVTVPINGYCNTIQCPEVVPPVMKDDKIIRPDKKQHHILLVMADTELSNYLHKAFSILFRITILENPEQITESYTVDMLSADMGMCRTKFYTKIKEITDKTPTEYMHYFKMNKAKILLVTQQYTVTEIATFLGFCNAKYFGKRFKKFYKVPPTQYIKEVF